MLKSKYKFIWIHAYLCFIKNTNFLWFTFICLLVYQCCFKINWSCFIFDTSYSWVWLLRFVSSDKTVWTVIIAEIQQLTCVFLFNNFGSIMFSVSQFLERSMYIKLWWRGTVYTSQDWWIFVDETPRENKLFCLKILPSYITRQVALPSLDCLQFFQTSFYMYMK